jgi:tetratricopeptide (TPR) repeat protein
MFMRSALVKSFPVVMLLIATTIGLPAQAQGPQNSGHTGQTTGRALFDEGMALYSQGRFAEACPKFEASLKAYQGLGTRGKLAECYEKLGRYASAWTTYRKVADLAAHNGELAREKVARDRAKALEPKLSHLTVVLPPENDLHGLVVKENGNVIERAALGHDQPKDPGLYALEVVAPDHRTYTTHIVLAEGQSARFQVPPLEATRVAEVPPPSWPVPATPPTQAWTAETESSQHAWQKPAGFTTVGVGAVAIVVGAAFGLSAKSKYDNAFNSGGCSHDTNLCNADGQSAVNSARHQATASTIFFAAGGILAATGLVLVLTAPSAHSTGMQVVPSAYAGGGGVTLAGSL